jgi:hypothetical protein
VIFHMALQRRPSGLHFHRRVLEKAPTFARIQYSPNALSGKQYNQRSPGCAEATTG